MTEPPSATPITGVAAGVPFLAIPPSVGAPAPDGRRHAVPLIVAWHLMDPPRSEAAFAAALPLNGLFYGSGCQDTPSLIAWRCRDSGIRRPPSFVS